MPNTRKHKKSPNRRPDSTGWLTTDADEVERRRARGATEAFQIEPLAQGDDFFGIYQVGSDGGQTYRVEIRSLAEPVYSCNCPIQQLIDAGILSANQDRVRTLYRSTDKPKDHEPQKRLAEAREHLTRGEHKRRMAKVLVEGGFTAEALVPMRDAVEIGLQALFVWQGHDRETPPQPEQIDSVLVKTSLVPVETLSLVTHLRENESEWDESQGTALLAQSDRLLSQAASLLQMPLFH